MELIEQIRERLWEVREGVVISEQTEETQKNLRRAIRMTDKTSWGLADVLRAINNQHISVNSVKGNFMFDRVVPGDDRRTWNYTDKDGQRCVWNLALPLDEQEPEVIEFLARVLGITS